MIFAIGACRSPKALLCGRMGGALTDAVTSLDTVTNLMGLNVFNQFKPITFEIDPNTHKVSPEIFFWFIVDQNSNFRTVMSH